MANSSLTTPVVLLVFNRPHLTRQLFAQVRAARPAQLLVVADGPRPHRAGDGPNCAATRAIFAEVDWPCELLINYAEKNLGCARRVSSGIDWAFSQVAEAIILEDDCIPHPSFFPYCAALLNRYRHEPRVMMITGTNVLPMLAMPESYTFSRYFNVWGWATWRRAWAQFDYPMSGWRQLKAEQQLRYTYPERYMARHMERTFDLAHDDRIDSWAIRWFYSCLFNNGLCAVPRVNLIANVGGTAGTHTAGATSDPPLPTFELDTEHLIHPALLAVDARYDHALFERRIRVSPLRLLQQRASALLRRTLEGLQDRNRREI